MSEGGLLSEGVVFYATIDADSLRPYMPDVPILLPASSFARKGLRPPRIPDHVRERAADSGGFVATLRWGDYRYSPAEYVDWLATWRPSWAAMMDYCCEQEITGQNDGVVRERQERTTEMAWHFWREYGDAPWAWVPTVQGWEVADYRRHARELEPLVREMQQTYAEQPPEIDDEEDPEAWDEAYRVALAFRVGIGTLCRRASVGMIRDVVAAVHDELPGVPLHLWGVKLTLLKQGVPPGVLSVDSAAWNGMFGSDLKKRQQSGLTQREYAYRVALPEYLDKIRRALEGPRTRPLFCSGGAA